MRKKRPRKVSGRRVDPIVGHKTVVMGFPRVFEECLLALAEHARGGAAAVEGVNFLKVGGAKASEAPRALHAVVMMVCFHIGSVSHHT